MAEKESTTITISGHEYVVSANIDDGRLNDAVSLLNERIEIYKQTKNGDELRATVLAALTFAFDHTDMETENRALQETLEKTKNRVQDITRSLSLKMPNEAPFDSLED